MEIFEMIFNDNGNITTIELEHEPVGYDAIDFNLNQEDDRYGRDWFFAGNGNIMLELTEHSNPTAFYKFDEVYQKYGFESDIKFRVTDGNESFIGNVDLLAVEYNGHDTFKFSVNQETEEALIKKRSDLVVDMFATEDLDGNTSAAPPIKNLLLPAKEIYRESVWENKTGNEEFIVNGFPTGVNVFSHLNYSSTATKLEIKNTLGFIPYSGIGGWNELNANTKIIEAKTDLIQSAIEIEYDGSSIETIPGSNYVQVLLIIRKGINATSQSEWLSGEFHTADNYIATNGVVPFQNKILNFKNMFSNPVVKTGEFINIYFQVQGNDTGIFKYNNIKFTIKSYEQTFDVVTPAISIYDATKKLVKDISGLDVVFPMAQSGVLKNNYIFSGNMVRNVQKPFNISFDDLKKWFPELNLDYEIMSNNTVYIGKREDYYTDNEIDVFDNVAFDGYMETQNQRYALNKFSYKYSKYQSQKENTEENTNDIVHGEAEYHINNVQVEDEKAIEVEFVRDPFMLQETVNKALSENQSKATQDDDTIFIVDATNMTTSDYNKTKTAVLSHSIQNGILSLSNDGSFSWLLLGILFNTNFQILSQQNNGVYLINNVTDTVLELIPNVSGQMTFTGEVFTSFKYTISSSYVNMKPYFFPTFINPLWSLSTIQSVLNIKSPQTFANLRFSIGLNIRNYYKDFISTAVKTGVEPKQIKYINNALYENNAYNPKHYENADISLVDPILDTKVIETTLIMDFSRYMRMCRILRSNDRGFIRTFNPKGEPICLYPKQTTATYKTSRLKEVKITGELKNVPEQINITKTGGLYNIWIYKFQTFEIVIQGDYLIFKDSNQIPFYKKSHYSDIKVNGINYGSSQEVLTAINAL